MTTINNCAFVNPNAKKGFQFIKIVREAKEYDMK